MEGRSTHKCWPGHPHQGHVVRHSSAPQHRMLPVELGHQADR
jgi:hypothetical protein